jgi:hypothetical protein
VPFGGDGGEDLEGCGEVQGLARQGGGRGRGADGRGFLLTANSEPDPWRSGCGLPLAGLGEA